MQASAEFRLAVDCCRRSFAGARELKASQTLEAIDWDDFQLLVRFHRIEGLAWNSLSNDSRVPDKVRQALSTEAQAVAAKNLRMAAESRELLIQFEADKVPLLFLKGLTLGALAYGNPALKAAVDIDLLIDPADLGRAAKLLKASGYQLVAPADDTALAAWHRRSKESVWRNVARSVHIDLHTRTADNPRLIPTIDVRSPRRSIRTVGATQLPTLAAEELFAYLAVHGASSAWFRLKWISDFTALLHPENAVEIDRLYRRSQQLGAGRASGQALLLADTLFRTLGDSDLRRELNRDRATRLLHEAALRQVTGKPVEPTAKRGGTFAIHWTQFLLMPGLAYKSSEISGQFGKMLIGRTA